jgi:glycine/D-amino acid oxidase-like deaminating enzyme
VGKLNDQVFFAMGYNGRGVALATLLGHVLADLSAGQGSKLGPLASSLEPIPFHALRVPAKKTVMTYL